MCVWEGVDDSELVAEPLGVSVDDGVCVSLALCVVLGEIVPDGVSEVDGVKVVLPL